MKRNRLFSILLVVVLAVQALSVSVIAQSDETTTVIVDAVTQDQTVEVGNVTVDSGDGVIITAENGNQAEVSTGNVQASETGVSAEANGTDSTVDATVGKIDAEANGWDDAGIEASSSDGGTTVVQTESVQSGSTGVSAESSGENSSTTVEVSGEVKAEGNESNDTGIEASSSDGGTTVVQAESVQSESTGVSADSSGKNSSTTVEVSGDVKSEGSEWNNAGINASSSDGGTTVVQAESVQSESTGVNASSNGENSSTTVEVAGKVKSEGSEWNDAGIEASSSDGGTTVVQAESVQSESTGVSAGSSGADSSTTIEITGEVKAEGTGVEVNNSRSSSYDSENREWVYGDAGTVQVTTGDIQSGSTGVNVSTSTNGTTEIKVESIQSEGSGISAYSNGENSSTSLETGNITANGKTTITTNNYSDGSSYEHVNQSYGINVSSSGGGSVELKAGDVTSESFGVGIRNSGEGSVNIQVGNITSNGEATVTTHISSSGNSYSSTTSSYGININNSGLSNYSDGVWTYDNAGQIQVSTGDVFSADNGIYISNNNNGSITVSVNDVTSKQSGVEIRGNSDAKTEFSGEDIVTTSGRGITVSSSGQGGSTTANVKSVTAGGDGVYAGSSSGSNTILTAEDIISDGNGVSVNSSGENSSSYVQVGNITTNGETTITINNYSDGSTYSRTNQFYGLNVSSSGGGSVDLTAGDITSESYGVGIRNSGESFVNIETGNITANGEATITTDIYSSENSYSSTASSYGVSVNNSGSSHYIDGEWIYGDAGTVQLSTGDINSADNGIYVYNENKGTIIINSGNVTSNGKAVVTTNTYSDGHSNSSVRQSSGANIINYDGGTVQLSAGNFNSAGNGIRIYNRSGSDGLINAVIGDIVANGEKQIFTEEGSYYASSYGINIDNYSNSHYSDGVWTHDDAGEVHLTAGDVLSADNGVYISNNNNGTVTITVGDVTADGETIVVPNTYTYTDVEGNLHTNTYNSTYNSYGINISNSAGGTIDLTVGDITSASVGMNAQNNGNHYDESIGTIEISVLGNIISSSSGISSSTSYNGVSNITVEGDVTSVDDTAVSLNAYSESESNLLIGGSVNVSGSGDGMKINASNGSKANVSVEGDVRTADENGIGLSLYNWDYPEDDKTEKSTIDVLVAGTIAGGEVGVNIGSGITTDNVTLTVWQIELNDAGHAVESSSSAYDPEKQTSVRKAVYEEKQQEFEQSILYIIKLEQPEGAVLSATDADGNALEKSHDYEVAHEGDTVLMKIDIQSGFELYGAYNGLGEKVPLLRDANGNFYVEVPKGGGVYLSAKLGRIVYNPEPEDDDEPTPVQPSYSWEMGTPMMAAGFDEAEEHTITYDLNGGRFADNGENVRFRVKFGQRHVMLEAPIREGYRFRHWIGASFSRSDPRWTEPDLDNSYPYVPGSWFTVGKTDWTFIAVWDKIK